MANLPESLTLLNVTKTEWFVSLDIGGIMSLFGCCFLKKNLGWIQTDSPGKISQNSPKAAEKVVRKPGRDQHRPVLRSQAADLASLAC